MIFNKEVQIIPIICLICSIITLLAMVMSPGSAIRLEGTSEFNNLSIIEKVNLNLDNLREYLYTRNAVLVLLILIPINIVIYRRINKKIIKIPLLIIINLFCIASILQMIQYMITIDISRLQFGEIFILNAKKISIPFWMLFTAIFINVANTQYNREKEIQQCIENNETVLYLSESPIAIMQNFNPQSEFFVKVYKLNYNIPENVELKIKNTETILDYFKNLFINN